MNNEDLPARIDRLARKIEDPETCEWVLTGNFTERSALGFWDRHTALVDGSGREVNPPKDLALCGLGAGWLIECLVRAGLDVSLYTTPVREGKRFVRVSKGNGPDAPSGTFILDLNDEDLLSAVLAAAEAALGIET